MRVISIANFKGGTGKTVTACNMAAILADSGRKVLLIDADPQHNASDFFGAEPDSFTLCDVLQGYGEPDWHDNVQPTGREGLELLPGDMNLLQLDLAALVSSVSKAPQRLRDFLDSAERDGAYDYVIIDCPPSFTAASVAALSASDCVIIPTRVDAFSRAGVEELLGQLRGLGQISRSVRFRVLITMADRTNLSRQGAELLRGSGVRVFDTEIRSAVAVGESTYARQPLCDYAPRSTAAKDYAALVQEFLGEVAWYG